MFDELKCIYTLPKKYNGVDIEVEFNNLSYQTQSLKCNMGNYILDEGGTLYILKDEEKKRVDYFGNLKFYTFVSVLEGQGGWWIEYVGKFAYGVCLDIKLSKFYIVKQNGVDIV